MAAQPAPASQRPVLYVVGYSHLDTVWRWTIQQTIEDYLPDTWLDNLYLLEKYPFYVFNFTGAHRYQLMKEYHPEMYELIRPWVAKGRWVPNGNSIDENDTIAISAESQIRQVMYGWRWFKKEFGTESAEYMLPDCFGFPASLPSVLAHCGIRGFSTQKLTWGSAVGIPFRVGRWIGPDGKYVIAALDPGSYVGRVETDLSRDPSWLRRLNENRERTGLAIDYHYFGTGDTGGAPWEGSLVNLQKAVGSDGPIEVRVTAADQMFRDITPEQAAKLPTFQGDMLLTEHSAGSITSQAYVKRWNRKLELLSIAAEGAAATAEVKAGLPYPSQTIRDAWRLTGANQMHDILPGTSLPQSYDYAWNDAWIAMTQFAGVVRQSASAVAPLLETRPEGLSLMLFNPLPHRREDIVEARVNLDGLGEWVEAVDPAGNATPVQVLERTGNLARVAFVAGLGPMSFASFTLRPSDRPHDSELQVSPTELENHRYRVRLNPAGDIESVYDKQAGKELLKTPIRLAFQFEHPSYWPAWNMDWRDRKEPPRGFVQSDDVRVEVVEQGPVRVALRVHRRSMGSQFAQTVRLSAGDAGDRVEFLDLIDWRTRSHSLKATFDLTVSNPKAVYNWTVGKVERGNNDPLKFEVPSHGWFGLTDADADYTVTILSDTKIGSDKPTDSQLRLTLLFTPGVGQSYADQGTQDFGRHEILYGLSGTRGAWQDAGSDIQALRLSKPIQAFVVPKSATRTGLKQLSLLREVGPGIEVMAFKKAEDGEHLVIRMVETSGQPRNTSVHFTLPIEEAWEVDGKERRIGDLPETGRTLSLRFTPYQIRSVAFRLAAPVPPRRTTSRAVRIDFNRRISTLNGQFVADSLDGRTGNLFAAEMLPKTLLVGPVEYRLASRRDGVRPDAVQARGQTIGLPRGNWTHVSILAAAVLGEKTLPVVVGDRTYEWRIHDWGGMLGQWDRRIWQGMNDRRERVWEGVLESIEPGWMRDTPLAWVSSHRHHKTGRDVVYSHSYLFSYDFELPDGATTITLPDDPNVYIKAVSVSDMPPRVVTVSRLLDDYSLFGPGPREIELR